MKTTNAKAKAYQTPAPLTIDNHVEKTLQKTSPRLRRPKVKIHQPEPVAQDESEEEPEIEHVPPKEIPLPDHPSDDDETGFGPDKTFPQFEGQNFTRGYPSVYFNPVLPNGETYLERKRREQNEKTEAELDAIGEKLMQDDFNESEARLRAELGLLPAKKTATTSSKSKPLAPKSANQTTAKKATTGTLSSRAAVAALAAPTKASAARQIPPSRTSRVAAPSSHTRINRNAQPAQRKAMQQDSVNSGKHNKAIAAARSTLGYSAGRAAVSSLRAPPSPARETTTRDEGYCAALASLGLGNEDDELFGSYDAGAGGDEQDLGDDDEEIFQLTLGA